MAYCSAICMLVLWYMYVFLILNICSILLCNTTSRILHRFSVFSQKIIEQYKIHLANNNKQLCNICTNHFLSLNLTFPYLLKEALRSAARVFLDRLLTHRLRPEVPELLELGRDDPDPRRSSQSKQIPNLQ